MLKSYKLWIWSAMVLQLLTAGIHSLSFLNDPQPTNDDERKMIELMTNLRPDMGAGFNPSMLDFFLALSSCFSMLYFLGGILNIHLHRKKVGVDVMKGVLNINIIIFGASFIIMYFFTFLPPVVLTGLTFVLLLAARLTIKEA